MNYKISIIVPIYNVEKYLSECLDSLVCQTLKDIEIIAVNDGSSDNSLAILNIYREQYPEKIKIFTTENMGLSHARNFGLQYASGEYIQFVDSDDYIHPSMSEKLYKKAVRDNNDLVLCRRFVLQFVDQKIKLKELKVITHCQNFKLKDNKFLLASLPAFAWQRLIKRELADKFAFVEGMWFEDIHYSYCMLTEAENIGVVDEALYYYRKVNTASFTSRFRPETFDLFESYRHLIDYYREKEILSYYYNECEYICLRHILYRFMLFLDTGYAEEDASLAAKFIKTGFAYLDQNFPQWRDNNYLNCSSAAAIRNNLELYTSRKKMLRAVRIKYGQRPFTLRIQMIFRGLR